MISTSLGTLEQIISKLDEGVIVIDADWVVTIWNPWMVRFSGISSEKAIGSPLTDLFPSIQEERLYDVIQDASKSRMSSYLARAFHPHPLPLWPEGAGEKTQRIFQDISVSPIGSKDEGTCLIRIRDVSADHFRENMLRRHEAFFRGLLNDQHDPMLRASMDGTITFTNDSACAYLGIDPKIGAVGRNISEFIDQSLWDRFSEGVKNTTPESPVVRLEQTAQTFAKGAGYFDISLRVFFGLSGNRTDFQIYAHDTTERTERELEMREQWEQLRQTTAELSLAKSEAERHRFEAEKANRAKSEFLANMSHELRTPLNSVMGFSEIIADRVMGERWDTYSDYARSILQSGQHLLSLINDILDLSKVEAGKLDLIPTTFNVAGEIKDTMESQRVVAEQRGVRLIENYGDNEVTLFADRRSFRQIFLNLISNAIKFTPQGGRVTVQLSEGNGLITLSVEDTGIGIPENNIAKVFDPFEQVKSHYNSGEGGTGLGLALVQRLTEMHGGTVSLESAVGKGTTVTVKLPTDHLKGES